MESTTASISATNTTAIDGWLNGRSLDDYRRELDQTGYVIFPDVLKPAKIAALRQALAPYLAPENPTGRNDFEGVKTHRVYALLAKSPVFAELATQPLALAFAEAELGASCLLSACLAINLYPGETAQPWHYDDAHADAPRPRASFGVSAFWAIDEMTADNGATEIIPGSHLWGDEAPAGAIDAATLNNAQQTQIDDDPGAHPDAIKVLLSPGSLMITKGTLWHRGGANRSDKPRLIITPQYCAGWVRQLENMPLAVPAAVAATLPRRAQELLGYSIHPPFMGYVNGMHPQRTLNPTHQITE